MNLPNAIKQAETLTAADYRDAILVQDACNLSGVVRSFSRVMRKIFNETYGTKDWNRHPIAVMYASKIASLTGCEDTLGFHAAYEACKLKGGE